MTRSALRMFFREPGFAASAVLTLALGIAASTAMFSVLHTVVLAPVPHADPHRVVAINTRWRDTGRLTPRVSGADWIDLAAARDLFEHVARYHGGDVGVQLRDRAEWAGVYWVSPEFFDVFGVNALRGRTLTAADEERSVVVSPEFARLALGGVDRAAGQQVRIDTHAYEVVGVMPEDFSVPLKAGVWVAAGIRPENHSRTAYNYRAVARLRPGIPESAVAARLEALATGLGKAYPENSNKSFAAVPLRDNVVRGVRPTVVLLMAAVLLLLAISSTNVAHLLLARAAARTREFAVRAALGAGARRIAAGLLVESLFIGLAGGVAGIALAQAAVRTLVWLAPAGIPRIDQVRLDWTVLAFGIGVSTLASVLFGVAPLGHALSTDLRDALSGRGTASPARAAVRLRGVLVAAEIALSFTLAVGAGLLVRSFVALNSAPLGFRPDGVLVVYAHAPANTMAKMRAITRFFDQTIGELERMPGVQAAAGAMGVPTGSYGSNGKYAVEGQDFHRADQIDQMPDAGFRLASRSYFRVLGVPLVAGREFDERDQYDAPFVAIVSQSLARRSFPNADPIGRKIQCGLDSDQWMTIVGVVGEVRPEPGQAPGPELYMPFEQHPVMANELQVVVRTAGPPRAMADAVARKLRALNPEVAIKTTTLDSMVYESMAAPRFRTVLITLFAAVALLLAMAGIYGVMAYLVTRRTPEIGLRMALGCSPAGAVRLVLLRAAAMAVAGLAAGVGLCVAVSHLMESMLFGVHSTDLAGYVVAATAIALVTLAAALVPAWRASRIDPAVALRAD